MKKKLLLIVTFCLAQFVFAQAPMGAAGKGIPIPFENVENQPLFPGGLNEFIRYIGKNFRAPEVEGLSGVLKVSFVIETNGTVDDIKIVNDLGHGSGDEAKRVLKASPKWTPGDHGGKPVRVVFTLPITIRN